MQKKCAAALCAIAMAFRYCLFSTCLVCEGTCCCPIRITDPWLVICCVWRFQELWGRDHASDCKRGPQGGRAILLAPR